MDGSAAIERNRLALKRIVASLIAMAGFAVDDRQSGTGNRQSETRMGDAAPQAPTPDCRLPIAATLPRHLRLAILRLLRPAEAAARRLIIAAARGLAVSLPPPRKPTPKPVPPDQFLRRLGIAVVMSPADRARAAAAARRAAAPARPRSVSLPLFDPLRRPQFAGAKRRYVPARAVPRIMLPGVIEPYRLPPPPSHNDRVSAARLGQRLAALAAALDDLPRQAMRFARWKARRDQGLARRAWPLRGGRPPGGRLSRFDPTAAHAAAGARGQKAPRNVREVDEILAHAHSLALYALENPDTS